MSDRLSRDCIVATPYAVYLSEFGHWPSALSAPGFMRVFLSMLGTTIENKIRGALVPQMRKVHNVGLSHVFLLSFTMAKYFEARPSSPGLLVLQENNGLL
jgi:hypothetical protein